MGFLAEMIDAFVQPPPQPQPLTLAPPAPAVLPPHLQAFVYVSQWCVDWLARAIAQGTDLSYCDAFQRLNAVPDTYVSELGSPDGWGRLAAHVTGEVVSPITVTVH